MRKRFRDMLATMRRRLLYAETMELAEDARLEFIEHVPEDDPRRAVIRARLALIRLNRSLLGDDSR